MGFFERDISRVPERMISFFPSEASKFVSR